MGLLGGFVGRPTHPAPHTVTATVEWTGRNLDQILRFAPNATLTETGAIYLPSSLHEDNPWLDLYGYLVLTAAGHYPATAEQGAAMTMRTGS